MRIAPSAEQVSRSADFSSSSHPASSPSIAPKPHLSWLADRSDSARRSRVSAVTGDQTSRISRHSVLSLVRCARLPPLVPHFGHDTNYLKHDQRSPNDGGEVPQKSGGRTDRRIRRQQLWDTRNGGFDSTGDFARYRQQNQRHSLLTPRTVGHK